MKTFLFSLFTIVTLSLFSSNIINHTSNLKDDGVDIASVHTPDYRIVANPLKAYNDINQTPEGVKVEGNLLTNDKEVDKVICAQYRNSTGVLSILSLGTLTPVYGKDMEDNWAEAGTFKLEADGSYIFTPKDGYIGYVPFDYVAEDEYGGTDDAELFIKVIPMYDYSENNPPIAQNDTYTGQQGEELTVPVLINDSDPDNDVLTVIQVKGEDSSGNYFDLTDSYQPIYMEDPDNSGSYISVGKAKKIGNKILFTSADDFSGDVSFPYVISDYGINDDAEHIDLAKAVITVPMFSVNSVFANDDANIGLQGQTVVVTDLKLGILGNDVLEDALKQFVFDGNNILEGGKAITYPGKGVLTVNRNGTYTFVPEPNFVGTLVTPYEICIDGDCDKATLYITILDEKVNAKDDVNQTPKGKAVTANVLTNDKGSVIEVTKITIGNTDYNVNAGTTGEVQISGVGSITVKSDGTYTFIPLADFTGDVPTISYTIKDRYENKDIANLNITVIPELDKNNDPPIANNDVAETEQNKDITIEVMNNDYDPDQNKELSVTKIEFDDDEDGVIDRVVDVPTDGSSITRNVIKNGQIIGTIEINNKGVAVFNPESDFTGEVPHIKYTIDDAHGGKDTADIIITVHPVSSNTNNNVYANDDIGTCRSHLESIRLNALENDFDPEGDDIEITSVWLYNNLGNLEKIALSSSISNKTLYDVNGQMIGTISIDSDGNVHFQGNEDFVGTIAIPYTIKDVKNKEASATIFLTQLANCENCALPIELYSFEATLNTNNSVDLEWVSLTEINNDYYSIYKSDDAESWELIEEIQGFGNSSEKQYYQTVDKSPNNPITYYKLTQTDYDGTVTNLGVRSVHFSGKELFNLFVYPNPTRGKVNLTGFYSDIKLLRISSTVGLDVTNAVNMELQSDGTVSLNLERLPIGVYFLQVDNHTIKIVKN